ncbi:hypothetical protein M0813_12692 [Anaeramoeba flamelloides]|uniref:Uncharacterized protein n=1 Tax=Anaeramoeba flamelloides TaxID=1746091 RepID=A0AAV7YN42_9EUKA|nr:hypothetical protein M0812_24402 [Anaeramoeba flamelloides]KAJ6254134.1 hypothetical protein M0813_12692 [Anaeramoeba flamelloides]
MKIVSLTFLLFFLAAVSAATPKEDDWKYCFDPWGFADICFEAYAIPDTLTVGIELTINGAVFVKEQISGEDICLDDDELLKLLELIPVLRPYKALINGMIALEGRINAEVFKVCLKFDDPVFTKDDFQADPHFDYNLMCIKDHCIAKGDEKLPHINIHF